MSDAVLSAGAVEAFGDVAAAVVGHNTLDGYAVRVEEATARSRELGTGVLVFLGHHLDVGDPAVVIHSDMCELPPCSAALAGQVTMDTVSRTNDTGEFLVSRCKISPGLARSYLCTGGLGSRSRSLPTPCRRSHCDTVEAGTDSCAEISQAVSRCRRNLRILCTTPAGVCRGLVCGRELRSSRPATPSSRYLRSHL